MGKKVQGISSINGRYKVDGEVKNSMGNGEAKELNMDDPWTRTKLGGASGRGAGGRRVQGRGE